MPAVPGSVAADISGKAGEGPALYEPEVLSCAPSAVVSETSGIAQPCEEAPIVRSASMLAEVSALKLDSTAEVSAFILDPAALESAAEVSAADVSATVMNELSALGGTICAAVGAGWGVGGG